MEYLIHLKLREKKAALFNERAMTDPRYTSPEHGIKMSEYVSDYDEELEAFRDRLESTVAKFIQNFK